MSARGQSRHFWPRRREPFMSAMPPRATEAVGRSETSRCAISGYQHAQLRCQSCSDCGINPARRAASGLDREVGIERLADLDHLLAGETAAGGKLGDRFEVMILPTRQAPSQHASRDAADVLEAVHDVARDEDDAA